jgi:hypothetical protein
LAAALRTKCQLWVESGHFGSKSLRGTVAIVHAR